VPDLYKALSRGYRVGGGVVGIRGYVDVFIFLREAYRHLVALANRGIHASRVVGC
jgi:hypothetical protein